MVNFVEHMKLMQNRGFQSVEILWLSNMQVVFWELNNFDIPPLQQTLFDPEMNIKKEITDC